MLREAKFLGAFIGTQEAVGIDWILLGWNLSWICCFAVWRLRCLRLHFLLYKAIQSAAGLLRLNAQAAYITAVQA